MRAIKNLALHMFLVPPDPVMVPAVDDEEGGTDSLVRTFSSLLAALIAMLWIAFREEMSPLRDLDSPYWLHW